MEGNQSGSAGMKWYYTAEAAQQRPYANGDSRIRAGYQKLAFGPAWSSFSAQISYERLGSNNGLYGFQTPLSYTTANGYSYAFFTIPAGGLRDLSISGGANWGRFNVLLKSHRFKADFGSQVYGTEHDAALAYRFTDSISVRAVFAWFRPAEGSGLVSTDRHYVTLQYDF
ncbi:MAG: hypothetical protein EXR27_09440 [Betaproteobacteria bacterium]|nr:hypothetical protein [Betaproteobacteria bacterium]